MSITETPSQSPEASGAFTLGQLLMATTCVALVVASTAMIHGQLSDHRKVENVIKENVLAGKLEDCSVLLGTQRHEGKCGSFGEFTVLSGGSELFVLEGQSRDNPPVAGSVGFFGFRANEKLTKFALGK